MKFIVKLFPEITIKSKSVRQRFSKILEMNLRNVLKPIDEQIKIKFDWDKILISGDGVNSDNRAAIVEVLGNTPGIASYYDVIESGYSDKDDIARQVLAIWGPRLAGKTFCVRAKRLGRNRNQPFTSLELERWVGGALNQNSDAKGVKLSHPDITVKLEVEGESLFTVNETFKGLGGFPLGTQEDVLSLISGGFDSGVSSYLFIKRGCRVHYCFFNLGGAAHEVGVKQVAHFLWRKYGFSHRVKFVAVPFEPVVAEILEKVDNGQMGVVLKRMMMRAAEQVAKRLRIEALVTGEALGQVSSQTLTNLRLIDQTTDRLVLRPLSSWDKQDIIDLARQIGTEDFAKTMPEYCGVISKKPTVKAVQSKLEIEEAKLSADLIERVIEASKVFDIRDIGREADQEVVEIETASVMESDAIVLDIRSPDEEDESPLEVDGHTVVHLPFYKLATQFADLDQNPTYYLYCAKGVMSKLQALYLHEQGFRNVKVYRP